MGTSINDNRKQNTSLSIIVLHIRKLIESIQPLDEREGETITEALRWIDSRAPLFRVKKPDIPPKHLVSYFILYDNKKGLFLLVDHIKAQQWLPTGGHVEPNEDPKVTVERESKEELGGRLAHFYNDWPYPLFITIRETVGITAGHTDVNLWYLLEGNSAEKTDYDTREFNTIRWFTPEEIRDIPQGQLDPHLPRFLQKVTALTNRQVNR